MFLAYLLSLKSTFAVCLRIHTPTYTHTHAFRRHRCLIDANSQHIFPFTVFESVYNANLFRMAVVTCSIHCNWFAAAPLTGGGGEPVLVNNRIRLSVLPFLAIVELRVF